MADPLPVEPAVAALRALVKSLEDAEVRLRVGLERAVELDRLRSQGYSWGDIVATEPRPLIVEMVSHTVEVLAETGARFRRIESKAMHAEGLKVEEIADLFGLMPDRVRSMLEEPD
jgi:hypothetical protein